MFACVCVCVCVCVYGKAEWVKISVSLFTKKVLGREGQQSSRPSFELFRYYRCKYVGIVSIEHLVLKTTGKQREPQQWVMARDS